MFNKYKFIKLLLTKCKSNKILTIFANLTKNYLINTYLINYDLINGNTQKSALPDFKISFIYYG